ncbi:MAG: cadherin-like beta sandwich domain-containing protein, partial [Chloroflexi bacterium]|nr:cadherin-like beta sandwich domain-containing protein [Chloroflexota bacterium]
MVPIVAASNTTAFEAVEKYGRSNAPATIAVLLHGGRGGRKIKWPGSNNSSCEGTGNDITVNVSTIGGTGSNTDGVAATPPADPRVTSHSSFSAYTEKWAIGGADYGAPTMNGAAITSLTFACEAGATELRKEFTVPIMDDGIDDSGEVFAVKLEVATTTTRPGLVLPPGEMAKAAIAVSGGLVRVHILNHDYLSALVIEQRVGDEWSRLDYGTLTDTPSVTVPYETTHIRVTPTAGNAGSTLKVGSPLVSIASGGTSDAWALDVGANSFGIEVRERDGATRTYKIAVTRQEQSALSANADLKALAVGTASSGNGPWTKLDIGEFSAGATTYTVTVPHTATNVRIAASTADSNATHRKGPVASLRPGDGNYWTQNFALGEGANDLAVEVTAEDGKTMKTYTVTVTREARVLSSSADLSGLSAEAAGADGRWSALDFGTFSAGTTAYSVTVPYGTVQARLSATATDSAAKVERGTETALSVGSNELSVSVTAEDGKTRKTYTVTVTRGAAQPLTVAFENAPAEHAGGDPFAIDLRFSEALGEGGVAPSAASFAVQAGDVAGVERVSAGLWRVRVQPKNWKDVTVTLSTPVDCAEAGAVCTADGRALSNTVTATVGGPVRIRVEGARAKEDKDEALEFAVTLSRAASHEVSVDYATADDTAVAGSDYTATSGTLVFAAGETAKTVSVPLLDDAVDEGKEILHLHLSNPRGAYLRDIHRRARGIIVNDDPLQSMWLSRFGRTVGGHIADAVSDRLSGGLAPGAHATLAGQGVDLTRSGDGRVLADTLTGLAQRFGAQAPASDDPLERHGVGGGWNAPASSTLPGSTASTLSVSPGASPANSMTGRELLLGSSFHLAGKGEGSGPGLAAWGRAAHGSFSGE